jgi:ABC-type spermidine/putrescine transport system permease subunit I
LNLHLSPYINHPSPHIGTTQINSNLRNLILFSSIALSLRFSLSVLNFLHFCKCISIPLCILFNCFFLFECLIFFLCFDFVWFRSKFTILIHWEEIDKHRSVSNCLKTVSITLSFSFFCAVLGYCLWFWMKKYDSISV